MKFCGREPVEEDRIVHDGDEGGEGCDGDLCVLSLIWEYAIMARVVRTQLFLANAPLTYDFVDVPFEFSIACVFG